MKLSSGTISMERSARSKLSDLRDHLTMLQLNATVQREMLEVLEEVEKRLYSVEQDLQLLKGQYKAQADKISSLNTRYSELLYALGSRK